MPRASPKLLMASVATFCASSCWRVGEGHDAAWLNLYHTTSTDIIIIYGGCRKILLLFGRIGPLALRPCALLRAWGFLPHSINIIQIPLWYGDMMWYGVSCARPCALLRGPAFLMPLYHALKILSPPKMWLKGRGFFINPHIDSNSKHDARNCTANILPTISIPIQPRSSFKNRDPQKNGWFPTLRPAVSG